MPTTLKFIGVKRVLEIARLSDDYRSVEERLLAQSALSGQPADPTHPSISAGILEREDSEEHHRLRAALEGLNREQLQEVTAITMLSNAGVFAKDWEFVFRFAGKELDSTDVPYLLGKPLGTMLRAGLKKLGHATP